jgi:parallel beta-helix repeat protein
MLNPIFQRSKKLRCAAWAYALLCPMWVIAQNPLPERSLTAGMVITASCRIKPGEYQLAPLYGDSVVVRIKGKGIEVDMEGVTLSSTASPTEPAAMRKMGYAIGIEGADITLRNARVHGFKTGLLARKSPRIWVENCDFSYNYRPQLRSDSESANLADWIDLHNNINGEWLQHGAGIYLTDCRAATIKDCRVTGGQHGLLMTACDSSWIYNNSIHFNSGVGIALCRTNDTHVQHNRLDWNVRGYQHNKYASGQRSAGVMCTDRCNRNVIAYNSATHCGHGFYFWAGQSVIDSVNGTANDNLIFGNDFSHSVRYGVVCNFSRNRISGNLLVDCPTGVWSYFTYDSEFSGNWFSECQVGLWLNNTQNALVRQNLFSDDSTAMRLTGDVTLRPDWAYAHGRDITSHHTTIDRNVVLSARRAFELQQTRAVQINGENLFFDIAMLIGAAEQVDSLRFLRNDIYGLPSELDTFWAHPLLRGSRNLNTDHPTDAAPANPYAPLEVAVSDLREPDSIANAIVATLPSGFPQGREFIMMRSYGPYDFRSPIAALETNMARQATFSMIGPAGDWEVTDVQGGTLFGAKRGTLPVELRVNKTTPDARVLVNLRYTSPEVIVDQFGKRYAPGTPFYFTASN